MRLRTTQEAAKELGKSKAHVITTLDRNPELRPAQMFGQNFMWTDEDVERLRTYYKTAKRGRPSSK